MKGKYYLDAAQGYLGIIRGPGKPGVALGSHARSACDSCVAVMRSGTKG